MVPTIFHRLPTIFITILCCLTISVKSGNSVPVLKDQGKQSNSTSAPAPKQKRVTVLGKYRDFTAAKKRNNSYYAKRQKKKIARNLSARSAIIMDGRTGATIYSKNSNVPRQPASTIKILTGMIALKSLKNNDAVSVSRKAARQPRSKVYLDQRKKYLANDLINAVLLASANDASVALAEKIAGSEKRFAELMTHRAKLWGARKTVCKTATGLTAKGQRSTARDLAVMFQHVMKDKEFARRMKKTKVRTSDGKLLRNHNKALWQVKGTQGGKTGYTNAARQTYVGKFKRGNDELIIAIMGSERMWTDIKKLVQYGFLQKQVASEEKIEVESITIAGLAAPQ